MPEIVGVVTLVVRGVIVGITGAVVSIINSSTPVSVLMLPAASVTEAITSKVPSAIGIETLKSQVPSPLSTRLPSPAV